MQNVSGSRFKLLIFFYCLRVLFLIFLLLKFFVCHGSTVIYKVHIEISVSTLFTSPHYIKENIRDRKKYDNVNKLRDINKKRKNAAKRLERELKR